MSLDLLPPGRNHIVIGTAADSPRLPHARFLPLLIFQQQNTRGYYAARLCPTEQTPGKVHTAAGHATYREMCRHVSPRFRLHPHLLSPRPPAAAAVEAAAAVAVRLKIPHPLRTARVPTIVLPSRGFSCCCTFSLRRDTTLPACSYTFTIGTFRRWWYSSLPFSTFGGWRLFPTGLSLLSLIHI